MKRTKIKRLVEHTLTTEEEFWIVVKWCRNQPEVINRIMSNKSINCPFPGECKKFPCATLRCNADMCNNGYAYKYS